VLGLMLSPLSADTFGNFTYTDNGSFITITDYPTSATGAVEVPAVINGKPVTTIGSTAFYGCSSLTGITMPSSVTSIKNGAFSGCSGLTNITISNSVTSIGSSAFYGCSSLTSITIPSGVTAIGSETFYGCSSLTSITVPNSITSIGTWAFHGCSSLTSIAIPNSITSIGDYAFFACSSLANMVLPPSVSSIGVHVFYACDSLTSITVDAANATYSSDESGALFNKAKTTLIHFPSGLAGTYTIPNGVITIADAAFRNCNGLLNVTIPNSVTSIGSAAFSGCSSLTSIYFKGDAPTLAASVFPSNPGAVVYYPLGTAGWVSTYGGLPAVAANLPVITPPVSQVLANPGDNVVLSVVATSAVPLTYQWQRNGSDIAGATSSTLALPDVQSEQFGDYTALVTNFIGTVPRTVTLMLGFTQAQVDAASLSGYQSGQDAVLANPNLYSLYTSSQVQALHVGTPLLAKDPQTGAFKLTIQAQKSTDLQSFSPLPFSSGTSTINGEGELEFQFTSPDNAAFFRLETK
jgi:hypothetical protein